MNLHYQTTPAHLFLLCLLVLSFCATCNVGKTVVANRKNVICIEQERDVLLKFKHHIESDYCGLMSSWGNPDCCTWEGVSCNNQSGHVIGLRLSGATYDQKWGCLFSEVFRPSLISQLKFLNYLDLSSNYFYDMVIPTSIGSLVNLIHLNLSKSYFSGNIPKQLGNLTQLTSFDLSRNDGLSAKSLNWLSRLTLLTEINLVGTNLSKVKDWSQRIGSLPLLEVLKMDHCQLSRPPSSSPFLHSPNLRVISLSGNDFSSPSSFQWLFNTSNNYSSLKQSLEYLNLSRTFLKGSIPDAIWKLESLTYLDISQNLLSSTIPDAIRNLEFLTYLDLSWNSLSSTIPDAIGNLEFLTYLDLSLNSLSSTIPDTIGNLELLTYLDLSYNLLSGPIPSTLGSPGALGGASSLSHLDLSNNHLKGAIPSSIANLEYLGYLDLSSNKFSGDIPCKFEIRKPPFIADFSHNNLSGSIPKHLSYLRPNSFRGNPNFRTDKIQGRCDKINVGLYVSIGLGFYTGFWAFCGTLTVKNSWRHAYFGFVDHILDNIYVTVSVKLARLRRNSQV